MNQKDVDSLMERSSEVLLEELHFYRDRAELRGKCDECGTQHKLLALYDQEEWICFDCYRKRQ